MHKDEENELSPDERMLIAQLPREIAPGDLLEERVVRALRSGGYLGAAAPTRQARAGSKMWRIAAAHALFAGGVATGKYLLMSDGPRTASSSAVPASSSAAPAAAGIIDSTPSRSETIPVRRAEPIVAEREMWL